MLRFLFGAAVASAVFYVVANHPDLVHRGVAVARDQIAVSAHRISVAASGEKTEEPSGQTRSHERPVTIDKRRVRALVPEMKDVSSEELWSVMDESDYDRQSAAAQVLLKRANIPPSSAGVEVIRRRYFSSGRTEDLMTGFSLLGLLASQGVPESAIVRQAKTFVERYPQHEACDNAVWALGELGSEALVPYFFQIVENPQKYGAAARERAFCCLVQCGRYSPAQRLDMVPNFIEVYEKSDDAETRSWSMQALAHCAPGVRARSISEWKNWWSRQ